MQKNNLLKLNAIKTKLKEYKSYNLLKNNEKMNKIKYEFF